MIHVLALRLLILAPWISLAGVTRPATVEQFTTRFIIFMGNIAISSDLRKTMGTPLFCNNSRIMLDVEAILIEFGICRKST